MSDSESNKDVDPFVLNRIYSDVPNLIKYKSRPIDEVKNSALVALDANVLLLPYKFASTSLSAVSKVYTALKTSNRLRVPERSVQEFLKHRSEKITEIDKSLSDQTSIKRPLLHQINFIENNKDIDEIRQFEKEISELEKKINYRIGKIRKSISSEVGSDPVSILYSSCLSDSIIKLENFDKKEFIKDLNYRYDNKIPPGYKDASKLDGGVGDLLIWKTLLQVGAEEECDLIFVTADSKGDWWSRSGASERVRLELVEEYRAASGGKSFYLQKLSDLLDLLGASSGEVSSVRKAEFEYKNEERAFYGGYDYRAGERRKLKNRILRLEKRRDELLLKIQEEKERSSEGDYAPSYLYRLLGLLESEIDSFRNAYRGSKLKKERLSEDVIDSRGLFNTVLQETIDLRRCDKCGGKRVTVLDDGRDYCFDCRASSGL